MVILLVGLEVILQLVDVGAQQCHLNFRGTGITFTLLKILNDLRLLTGSKCHITPRWLRCCFSPAEPRISTARLNNRRIICDCRLPAYGTPVWCHRSEERRVGKECSSRERRC